MTTTDPPAGSGVPAGSLIAVRTQAHALRITLHKAGDDIEPSEQAEAEDQVGAPPAHRVDEDLGQRGRTRVPALAPLEARPMARPRRRTNHFTTVALQGT
jgi:hypothetical protein